MKQYMQHYTAELHSTTRQHNRTSTRIFRTLYTMSLTTASLLQGTLISLALNPPPHPTSPQMNPRESLPRREIQISCTGFSLKYKAFRTMIQSSLYHATYLSCSHAGINFSKQRVASTHLTNIHPTRDSVLFKLILQLFDPALYVPLVRDEHFLSRHCVLCWSSRSSIRGLR